MSGIVISSKTGHIYPWRQVSSDLNAHRHWEYQARTQRHIHHYRLALRIIINYYWEFYLKKYLTIASIQHSLHRVLYSWVQIDPVTMQTFEQRPTIRRYDFSFWQTLLNPGLASRYCICRFSQYQLPGTSVSHYRLGTLWRVIQRAFISWGGIVRYTQGININDWVTVPRESHYDWGQEVGS